MWNITTGTFTCRWGVKLPSPCCDEKGARVLANSRAWMQKVAARCKVAGTFATLTATAAYSVLRNTNPQDALCRKYSAGGPGHFATDDTERRGKRSVVGRRSPRRISKYGLAFSKKAMPHDDASAAAAAAVSTKVNYLPNTGAYRLAIQYKLLFPRGIHRTAPLSALTRCRSQRPRTPVPNGRPSCRTRSRQRRS